MIRHYKYLYSERSILAKEVATQNWTFNELKNFPSLWPVKNAGSFPEQRPVLEPTNN